MNPERWQQLEAICHAALERPPDTRPAFLDQACGTDPVLRREAGDLLAALETDPSFLETPLVRLPDLAPAPSGASQEPRRIGPYHLVRPLGHGGMGEVYLATHEVAGVRQAVAVKVIRRGMDSDEVLRRFRREREILASLNHPNIAHLADAGQTDDGRPYFVMEYVEGEPIDAYCHRRQLTPDGRLPLMEVICAAVQHAHRNLVVHRDLKPSNILVTAEGIPKLLDFGIGKVLDPLGADAGPHTRTEVRVMTPEYASPEQVAGDRITTATDVHGLGVLLYQLLTGKHPFVAEGRTPEDIERAVRGEEPPRPSRVADPRWRRLLSGDLDTIVLKALHKEPSRRYASAGALAEDLERYREGRPVAARPDTWRYRAAKFVRRNPWGVAAGSTVAAALVALSLNTYLHSRQIARERDSALEVQNFLLESFGARGADADAPVSARELLDQQAETVDFAFADRAGLGAEMRRVLAEGYLRLGAFGEAEAQAREAVTLRRGDPSTDPNELAWALTVLGWIRVSRDAHAEADTLLREAIGLFRQAGKDGRRGLARALNDFGSARQQAGDLDAAEPALLEALDLRTRFFPREARSIGTTLSNLAALRYARGDYAGAVTHGEQALESLRRAVGPDHQRSMLAQSNLAVVRTQLGDWTGAELTLRDLLDRQTRVLGRTHPTTTRSMAALATTLARLQRYPEAESLTREALAAQERSLGTTHSQVGATLGTLASILSAQGRLDEAVAVSRRAVAIYRAIHPAPHVQTGSALSSLAGVHRRRGDLGEGVRVQREAVTVLDAAVGPAHPSAVVARLRWAEILNLQGRFSDALAVLDDAHAPATQLQNPQTLQAVRLEMARARLKLSQPGVAESLLIAVEHAFPGDTMQQTLERRLLADLRKELQQPR